MQPRTGLNRRIDIGNAARAYGRGDGSVGGSGIEIVYIADVVFVDTDEEVKADIPYIIYGQYRVLGDLLLDPDIHLIRSRGFIVRIEKHVAGRVGSDRKGVADVGAIALSARLLGQRLISGRQGCDVLINWDPSNGRPKGGAANGGNGRPGRGPIDGCDQRRSPARCGHGNTSRGANWGVPEKEPLLETGGPVEQDVIPNIVLVINAGAGADHGFATPGHIPGDTGLRAEILIRLIDPVAETGRDRVEQRYCGKVAVGAASVA